MLEDKSSTLVWTAPEFPFRVNILPDVLNEVRILAVEAFYSVPRGGVEIGGVFFGARDANSIFIKAHRQVRCEYSTGPSFTLSINDQLGLSGLLDQAHNEPDLAGMSPLGWYHSHTRSEILLSPSDLRLYSEFFPERFQIALVMRPANLQPTRGGFFFRDRRGNIQSEAPIREFNLEPPEFGLELSDAPNIPLPASRAPVPEKKPVAAVSITNEPDAPAVMPPPVAALAAAAAPSTAATAVAVATPAAAEPEVSTAAAGEIQGGSTDVEGIRSFDAAEDASRKSRPLRWVWAAVVLLVVFAGAGAVFVQWSRTGRPATLGLETYDINGAFLIRWDRNAPSIREASRAIIEIEDGGQKVDPVTLTAEELAIGGFPYMRRTAEVTVQMRTEGPLPLEESVNFGPNQALGSQPLQSTQPPNMLAQALAEKQHLTTELINESMQTSELRREVVSLRRQLAEERAHNTGSPNQ